MPFNVLIVDDQALIRKIHSDMLIAGGHSVQTANNGKEGLELFEKCQDSQPFDLVMTDEEMPVMTGLELAQALYQSEPGLPILMVSSVEDVNLMVSLMRMGITFFRKPLKKEELIPFLENVEKQSRIHKEWEIRKTEQERIESFIATRSFTLFMENEHKLIPSLIKYILNDCEGNGISEDVLFRVHFALEETLINAIAHGNLEMGSAEFKKDGNFQRWEDELERRSNISPYKERRVKIIVTIQKGKEVKISVQDEGKGFDHEEVLSRITSDDIYQAHGRGLIMLKGMADWLEFNRKGTSLYMDFVEPQEKE